MGSEASEDLTNAKKPVKAVVNLSEVSGLPISVDRETGALDFGPGAIVGEHSVRTLGELKPVLLDSWVKRPEEVYHMYRDVGLDAHREYWRTVDLRFDITVLPPALLGREFTKTFGHYHPVRAGKEATYPEVYEVLYGEALYLLQQVRADGARVEEFTVVRAGPGDKVLVPPGYGHSTINPANKPLVMANWVARGFSSIYKPVEERSGMAYYVVGPDRIDMGLRLKYALTGGRVALVEGWPTPRFLRNPKYPVVPGITWKTVDALWPEPLKRGMPMYTQAARDSKLLNFLL